MKKIILFTLSLMLLTGCQADQNNAAEQLQATTQTQLSQPHTKELYKEINYYLYTQVEITTYGKLDQVIYDDIWQLLDTIDQKMSMHIVDSDIAKINQNAGIEPVKIDDKTYSLIKTAIDFNAISPKFDITIGPLVELWGIGTDTPKVPSQNEIDRALSLMGTSDIEFDDANSTVFLKRKGMMIDLGSIAKGYAADQTKLILEKHGVDKAIVNFGGNILTLGEKIDDTPWKIGIQNPDQSRGSYIGVLSIADKAVVTSGTYERFFQDNGQSYHHILSNQDGMPIENGLWSVSIISASATNCDALSTLIFAEGLDTGMQTIEAMPNTEAIFITKDRHIYLSNGLKDIFKVADDSFILE